MKRTWTVLFLAAALALPIAACTGPTGSIDPSMSPIPSQSATPAPGTYSPTPTPIPSILPSDVPGTDEDLAGPDGIVGDDNDVGNGGVMGDPDNADNGDAMDDLGRSIRGTMDHMGDAARRAGQEITRTIR